MQRLFAAIMIPQPQREQLALITGGIPGATWISPEKYHITLRFIGEVAEPVARDIETVLHSIDVCAFDLTIQNIGLFDSGHRPRALWASMNHTQDLHVLHEKINQTLLRAGVETERRKYLPHISLAKLHHAPEGDVAAFIQGNNLMKLLPFRVDRFSLIESRLTRHGAEYSVVEEFLLSESK